MNIDYFYEMNNLKNNKKPKKVKKTLQKVDKIKTLYSKTVYYKN